MPRASDVPGTLRLAKKKKILVTVSSQEETTKRILKFETLVRVQYLVCRLEGLEERVSVKKKKNFPLLKLILF